MPKYTFRKMFDVDVFDIIKSQKWHKLKAYVFFNKSLISEHQVRSTTSNSRNPLQYTCQFHPPLDVIKCIYNAHPKAISDKDCIGHCALHIACANGCSSQVIKYLLKKYPDAVNQTDINNRNPFLLACRSYLWRSKLTWDTANKELLSLLFTMYRIAPVSSIIADCDEMTPLDYIHEREAKENVITYVQSVSSNVLQLVGVTNESVYCPSELELRNVDTKKQHDLKPALRTKMRFSKAPASAE